MKFFSGLLFCFSLLTIFSCNNNESTDTKKDEFVVTNSDTNAIKIVDSITNIIPETTISDSPVSLDSNLTRLSKEILLLLKNKDYKAFANYIYPESGVLFSPYGYIDKENTITLTRENFLQALNDGKKFNWGSYDGSGDPISLSLKDYLQKFVYNADYVNPEKFSVNNFLGKGNSLNNLQKIYPGLHFTESYFSGFKKEYSGMDWTTLRLVFEKSGDKYYVRAIVHDQWTT